MSGHTNGQWVIGRLRPTMDKVCVARQDGHETVIATPNFNFSDYRENALRIVACVNALEGLTTEQIEEGVFQNMREERDFLAAQVNALTKQRDELLAALHDAATSLETIQLRSFVADSYLDDKHSVLAYAGSRASVARESIAKAKGASK